MFDLLKTHMSQKIFFAIGVLATIAAAGYGGVWIYKKMASKKAPSCTSDADCTSGQKCMGGKCVSGCSATTDCPTGYVCLDGFCTIPENIGKCVSNSDCSDGYGCSPDGECVAVGAVECVGSGENCPSGWGCYNGVCKPGCESNIECAEDEACIEGECVAVSQE